jgi:predicted dehydrogenase
MADKTKVGVIGAGGIFWAYAEGCRGFDALELAAVSDIDEERARAKAQEFGVPRACSVAEVLADPEIEIVINLTVPAVHAEVSQAILAAGKHAYSEKPLAVDRSEGQRLLAFAAARGLRIGGAPDTFLGGGHQTCRKLIDDGWIGTPVAGVAFVAGRGPEAWHPNPDFFYTRGGGPLFDMGVYYITALVNLLGPVREVRGVAKASFAERIAGSPEHRGRRIPVEIPTHVTALLEFTGGAVVTFISSFDVWANHLPAIEIYGAEGSLSVPDPNGFGGPVRLFRPENEDWRDLPLTHNPHVQRGIGVADMASALRSGRPHRASGELAYHVLDVMQSIGEASASGGVVTLASSCARPAALPLGARMGEIRD